MQVPRWSYEIHQNSCEWPPETTFFWGLTCAHCDRLFDDIWRFCESSCPGHCRYIMYITEYVIILPTQTSCTINGKSLKFTSNICCLFDPPQIRTVILMIPDPLWIKISRDWSTWNFTPSKFVNPKKKCIHSWVDLLFLKLCCSERVSQTCLFVISFDLVLVGKKQWFNKYLRQKLRVCVA